MDHIDILQSKSFHGIVVTGFTLFAVLASVRELVPYADVVLAAGFVISWWLGTKFEREILIQAGLVERDEAATAEQQARPF